MFKVEMQANSSRLLTAAETLHKVMANYTWEVNPPTLSLIIHQNYISYEENQFEEHLSLYGHYKWYDYHVYPIVIGYDIS